jgi:hypothetical protein
MLGKWTELLPLFVVRWLALRYCERVPFEREGNARVAAVARPDVLVRVPPRAGCEKDPRGCWNVRCQLGKRCCRAVDA